MRWDLTPRQDSLLVGQFTKWGRDFVQIGPLIKVMGLLLGVITCDIPVTGEPMIVRNFKNELTKSMSNYPAMNFPTP